MAAFVYIIYYNDTFSRILYIKSEI